MRVCVELGRGIEMERETRHTIVITACVLLAAVLWLGSLAAKSVEKARLATCQSSEKMLVYAMKTYADDYDGRLPVRPWPEVFSSERCPDDRQRSGPSYALHQRWLQHPLPDDQTGTRLLLIYESAPEPFAYRHKKGMNVGFVDGHVRWYPRDVLAQEMILSGSVSIPSPPAP